MGRAACATKRTCRARPRTASASRPRRRRARRPRRKSMLDTAVEKLGTFLWLLASWVEWVANGGAVRSSRLSSSARLWRDVRALHRDSVINLHTNRCARKASVRLFFSPSNRSAYWRLLLLGGFFAAVAPSSPRCTLYVQPRSAGQVTVTLSLNIYPRSTSCAPASLCCP